jgi:hypothetical protein
LGVEKENIIEPQPSVEEDMAKTLNIDMYLTSRICEGQKRWRNQVFCGHFKTFLNCNFRALPKKHKPSRTVVFIIIYGPPADLEV